MWKNEHKKNRPAAANNRTVDSENGITRYAEGASHVEK
nr:MAG TPA: hypothetical protein [Bacteriophage sp.]